MVEGQKAKRRANVELVRQWAVDNAAGTPRECSESLDVIRLTSFQERKEISSGAEV
jgi:hypothetical protein